MRRRFGRAFLWFAAVLGGICSAFATIASFWMIFAPFFETHRSLTLIALAGIPALAGSVWMGTGVVTLAEMLRETPRLGRQSPADESRT